MPSKFALDLYLSKQFYNEKIENITKMTYDEISEDWDKKRRFSWKPVFDFLDSFSKKEDLKLLDIGCGGGRDMELALQKGFKKENIRGCDFSSGQVDVVLNKGFSADICDMTNLPYLDLFYDVVLCIASFHHLMSYDLRIKALTEIRRVLSKEGTLLISNWMPNEEFIKKQIEKGKFCFLNDTKKDVKVTYTMNKIKYDRYYHIFEKDELKDLVNLCDLTIISEEFYEDNFYLVLKKI